MIRSFCQRLSKSNWPKDRCYPPRGVQQFLTLRSFSVSEEEPPPSATIVQGPSLLASTGVPRPSPSLFLLPGLRSLPFWTAPGPSAPAPASPQKAQQARRHRVAFNDATVAAAVQHVEAHYAAIREEYFSAVLGQGTATDLDRGDVARPLEPDYDQAAQGGELSLHAGTWDWHSYILNGEKHEQFKERCPKTAQVIDDLEKEGILFGTPFGFCFFSTLHGKSSIKAHSGAMNLRLRMHLPLLVPKTKDDAPVGAEKDAQDGATRPTVGLRVGDQVQEWHEGSAIVLDDSYVHEVWNESEESRVLLLLDLWHPDVRREERENITHMFSYAREKGWIGAGKEEEEKKSDRPAALNLF